MVGHLFVVVASGGWLTSSSQSGPAICFHQPSAREANNGRALGQHLCLFIMVNLDPIWGQVVSSEDSFTTFHRFLWLTKLE